MKNINRLNLIFVSIIVLSGIYGFFYQDYLAIALALMLPLGLFQIILAIYIKSIKLTIKYLNIYEVLVMIYFSIFILGSTIARMFDIGDFLNYPISIASPILAIFFTWIIFNASKTEKKMSFLTAEWNNLVLINYEIDPKILEKYVPKGTELDFWNDKCYISFIGFMFENVRVLGIKIPSYSDFEEVNLRFYVKRFENGIWKRGAVFISEIVPKSAITMIANTLYHEHYRTLPMRNEILEKENSKSFKYQWTIDRKWNTIEIETHKIPIDIEPNSEAEFITEHYFGYTKVNEKTTFEYEVRHPRWQQLEVIANYSKIDFEQVYGQEFAFVKDLKPTSVFLAIGSKISIEGKKKLK